VPFGNVLKEVAHWEGSASAAEMARSLEAGIMVTGIVTSPGSNIQLRAEIIRVANREMIQSVDASGPASESREPLVEQLKQRLMGTLAMEIEWGGSHMYRPPTYEAYQSEVQGANAFNARDWDAAIRHLSEAVAADSTLLGDLWWLAMAYVNLGGHRTQADSLLHILQERKSELTPVERLQLEYSTAPDAQSRIRTLESLREMDPVTIGWSHDLASILQSLGRVEEARQVLSDVDLDHWSTQTWSPFWRNLAQANHLTGRYQEELEVAQRAQELFPGDLQHVGSELKALLGLGRAEEMTPILDELQASTGGNPTSVLRVVSRELAFFGYPEESKAVAQRAIDWATTWRQDPHSLGMAISLLQAGRPAEAAPMLRRLVAEDPENDARMGWLGIALAQTGDTEGAEGMIRDLEGLGSRYWLFQALILAHLDRKEEATRLLNRGLQEGLGYTEVFNFNYFGPLWDYEPFQQVIAPKG
jgi:tetratricopeptide (TPR) repeat protein